MKADAPNRSRGQVRAIDDWKLRLLVLGAIGLIGFLVLSLPPLRRHWSCQG